MKRVQFNSGIRIIAYQYNCSVVQSPYIQEEDVFDGIHPSRESGVPKLVSAYKRITNKILGIKDHTAEKHENDRRYTGINLKYRPSFYNYSQHRRTKYDNHPKFEINHNRPTGYYGESDVNNWNDNPYIYEQKNMYRTDTTGIRQNQKVMDYNHGYNVTNRNQNDNSVNPPKFDESAQDKLRWFLKSFIEELN